MKTREHHKSWDQWSASQLREWQAKQLREYLRRVVLPFSPYYKARFRELGLNADSIRSLEDLQKLPFTSKADLLNSPEHPQRAREFVLTPDPNVLARRPSVALTALIRGREYVKDQVEREYRPIFMTSTTGRSADPIPFFYSHQDIDNLSVAGKRLFEVCGAERDMRLMNLFPHAPHLAYWLAHFGGNEFGTFVLSTGGGKCMGTDAHLRMIQKIKPDVLIGMPTFIYHVFQQAVDAGMRLEHLRRVVLGGERVAEGLRKKLTQLAAMCGSTSLDVVGTYGFTEAKMAWGQCAHAPLDKSSGYHLYPDLGIFEVVHPKTGELLPSGSPGELVFTPLKARGSVVLRYRTGDVVDGGIIHEPCPHCGRDVPRIVGNIRRSTEVKELRLDKIKGTLVDFNQLEHVLDDCSDIGAWQLELRKRNDDPLEVDEVVLHAHKTGSSNTDRLTRDLQNQFFAKTEIHLNRILFHEAEEIRQMQGVGVQLKEQKVVDHRPSGVPSSIRPSAVSGSAMNSGSRLCDAEASSTAELGAS